MTTLRERCVKLAGKIQRDGMLRQGSPPDTILEFVLAEIGRDAAPECSDALPLVLYFGSEADREEVIALVHEAKPGMIARKV